MHMVTPTVYASLLFSTLKSVCEAGDLNLAQLQAGVCNIRTMLHPVQNRVQFTPKAQQGKTLEHVLSKAKRLNMGYL